MREYDRSARGGVTLVTRPLINLNLKIKNDKTNKTMAKPTNTKWQNQLIERQNQHFEIY